MIENLHSITQLSSWLYHCILKQQKFNIQHWNQVELIRLKQKKKVASRVRIRWWKTGLRFLRSLKVHVRIRKRFENKDSDWPET